MNQFLGDRSGEGRPAQVDVSPDAHRLIYEPEKLRYQFEMGLYMVTTSELVSQAPFNESIRISNGRDKLPLGLDLVVGLFVEAIRGQQSAVS